MTGGIYICGSEKRWKKRVQQVHQSKFRICSQQRPPYVTVKKKISTQQAAPTDPTESHNRDPPPPCTLNSFSLGSLQIIPVSFFSVADMQRSTSNTRRLARTGTFGTFTCRLTGSTHSPLVNVNGTGKTVKPCTCRATLALSLRHHCVVKITREKFSDDTLEHKCVSLHHKYPYHQASYIRTQCCQLVVS